MLRWLTCLFFFVLYIVTLARGVLSADNGEFQLISTTLGLAHPPGFPLYTILTHLFTKLPLPFTPAVKVNLFSAVTSTLTLGVLFATIERLLGVNGNRDSARVSGFANPETSSRQLAAIIGAGALGTATTFWAQATTANIRSLTALFAALCLYFLVKLDSRQDNRSIFWFALALGFGVTHHLSLAFMGMVMVVWVVWHNWRSWWKLAVGVAGLLPLIYLPLVEPNLRNGSEFLNYALGLGFGGDFFYFISPSQLWLRADVMWNVLTFQFHPVLLLTALFGWIFLLLKSRRLGLLLGGTFLIHTFITATYRAPQTVEYMLPAYVPLAICLGVGVSAMTQAFGRFTRLHNKRIAIPLLFLLLIGWQGVQRFPSFWWLRDEDHTIDYAKEILATAPPDATILSNWHWFTPMRYLQEIAGERPDLDVQYVFPQGETVEEKWAGAIASADSPILTTDFHGTGAPRPSHNAFLYRAEPLWPPLDGFTPFEVQLGATIQLYGYQVSATETAVGEEIIVTVVWEPMDELSPLNLFAHLVDQPATQLFAQDDQLATIQPDGFSVTQFRLTSRIGTVPGDFQIMVGAYLLDGTPLPNEQGEQRTTMTTLAVTSTQWRPYTRNPVWFGQTNERGDRLIGYDFDVTVAPRLYMHWQSPNGFYSTAIDADHVIVRGKTRPLQETRYVPLGQGIVWLGSNEVRGENFVSVQEFVANRPITRDLRVSVRLDGYQQDGITGAWRTQSDGVPATGAIPTLKWIAGSKINDPHPLVLGESAFEGQRVEGWLTVYDAFTNRPIPILDERITAQGVGIPLGTATVSNSEK